MVALPVRYDLRERAIVGADGKVICHIFEGRGEKWEAGRAKGEKIVEALNHTCQSAEICEKCGKKIKREEARV